MKGEAAATIASAPETFIVLKKNQALEDRLLAFSVDGMLKNYAQALDEPLHDTHVVEHLNECNEENDRRELENSFYENMLAYMRVINLRC